MTNRRALFVALAAVAASVPAFAQAIPAPPKPDVPYLIHAANLLETESGKAVDKSTDKETRYAVAGATSSARTPLALPEFAFRPEDIDPDTLELYRFEPAGGQREILLAKKKKTVARPFHITTLPSGEKGVYRIRVSQTLTAGEYCLTPQGRDDVFCFNVF